MNFKFEITKDQLSDVLDYLKTLDLSTLDIHVEIKIIQEQINIRKPYLPTIPPNPTPIPIPYPFNPSPIIPLPGPTC